MTTNSITKELKAAQNRWAVCGVALEKIQAALSVAAPAQPDAEVVANARRDLEDCLARRVLGEVDATAQVEETEAYSRMRRVESEFESSAKERTKANLALDGLNRRLLVARADEAAAKKAVEDLQLDWIHQEFVNADEAYTKQAAVLEGHYRRALVCAYALRGRGGKLPQTVELTRDLDIPTIGPVSSAAAADRYSLPHGVGALLCNGVYLQRPPTGLDEVYKELADLLSAKEPSSALRRIANMVSNIATDKS